MTRASSSATKMSLFTVSHADLNKLRFSKIPTVPRQQPAAAATGSSPTATGPLKDFAVVQPGAKKHMKRQRQPSGSNATMATEEVVDAPA